MDRDIPMIFIAGFLAFFMGGYIFTYFAILWFETKAKKEEEKDAKILDFHEHHKDLKHGKKKELYSQEKKIA